MSEWLFATRVLFVLFVGVVAVSCRNDAHAVDQVKAPVHGPSAIQYGIAVTYADTSEMVWKLSALQWEEERSSNGPLREVFSGSVRAVQFVGSRATGNEMSADYVVRDLKERVWELKGNVEIRTSQHKKLRTESLFWNREEGRVFGESWVEISEPNQTLTGTGFEAKDDLSVYSIFEVSGSSNPN